MNSAAPGGTPPRWIRDYKIIQKPPCPTVGLLIPHTLSVPNDNPGSMTLTRADEAAAIFTEGYSCSQAVCAAFAGDFGIDRDAVIAESADLIYHWLVVLTAAGVSLDDVAAALEAREGVSGVTEKAGRKG